MAHATTLEQRFRAKFTEGAPDECWEWHGARLRKGEPSYGTLRNGMSNTRLYAHRFALELELGRPLGPGEQALHACDNPPCVNPSHLRSGDQLQNIADAVERDRLRKERCRKGHLRTPENTRLRTDSRNYVERHCRDCERERHQPRPRS